MGYISLVNYKYDTGLHQQQSGPYRAGDDLALAQKYLVVSSGYVDSLGNQVSWYGVNDFGADYGRPVIGPPNSGAYVVDSWRAVPVAVSGYWSDYNFTYYSPSGELSVYNGFRGFTTQKIANAKVSTTYNPPFGIRDTGAYTYYFGDAPSSQSYDPYNTPEGNTSAEGTTGGGVGVINLNALAAGLRVAAIPGDVLEVEVLRTGDAAAQGVGYLDDGTMVVIENGERAIGSVVRVSTTNCVTTAAGRIIFAKLLQEHPEPGSTASVTRLATEQPKWKGPPPAPRSASDRNPRR